VGSVLSGSSALSSISQSSSVQRNKPGVMHIGASGTAMKRVVKRRAKSPMEIAQITPTFGLSSGNLHIPAGTTLAWEEMMKGSVLIEKDLCFETNLLDDIFDIIAEAELMDQLGFALEPTIHSVAVQKDNLHQDLEAVQNMIKEYNTIVESLTMAEVRFLISCALVPA
jgi:hypothetical protein